MVACSKNEKIIERIEGTAASLILAASVVDGVLGADAATAVSNAARPITTTAINDDGIP